MNSRAPMDSFITIRTEEENDKDLSNWEFINTSDIDTQSHIDSESYSDYEYYIYDSDSDKQVDTTHHHNHKEQEEEEENDQIKAHYNDNNKEEEEEEEEEDGYDLDDELVPWNVSNKFGKQRMRKLGKRSCAKMNKAKRLVNMYSRPGCVHGKHGVGLKHCY